MTNKINTAFIAAMVLAFAAAGGLAQVLHIHQVGRIAGALLADAGRAEKAGDPDRARAGLGDYLHFRPDDRRALARYGLLLAASARRPVDKARAAEILERVVRGEPDDARARRVLAGLLMDEEVNRLDDARGQLEILLEGSPDDGELEAQLARCLEREARYKEASRHYAAAIELVPSGLGNYVGQARMLRAHLDRPADADRVMDARGPSGGVVSRNPGSFRALLARAAYRRGNKIDGASDDARRAFEMAPGEPDALLAAAEVEAEAGDRDSARRDLEAGLKLHPADGRICEALANVEVASGRPQEAERALRRGLEAFKDGDQEGRIRLWWSLAELMIGAGRGTEARAVLRKLSDEQIRPELLDFLKARVDVGEGKWLEAALLLEDILPRLGERRELAYAANLLLGRCYEQTGDADRRHAAYLRAVALDPLALPGKVGLASVLAEMGRLDEASALHGQIAEANPRSRVDLARLAILRALRRPEPRRDWPAIDRALDDADRAAPGSPEVVILRAEALAARGRREEVIASIREAREGRPDLPEFWVASAEFEARFGPPEAALATLADARARLGDRPEFRLAAARIWADRKGPGAAGALAGLGGGLDALPTADRVRVLRGLAESHERAGDAAGAARVIAELVRLQPGDLGLRVAMFDAAIGAGDAGSAARMVDDMRAIEGPEGAFWRFGRANLLFARAQGPAGGGPVDRGAMAEARTLLNQVIDRRPSWSRPFVTRGDLTLLLGRPDVALKDYLHAIELGDRDLVAARKAVQILYDMRRYDQADALLRSLIERGGEFEDLASQKLVAQLALQTRNPARALDIARRSVPAETRDPAERAWLGQILFAAGKADEAELEIRRAIALDPKSAKPYVTLLRCLAASGARDKAGAVIAEANAAIPGGLPPLPLATCLATLGRNAEARAQYRKALEQKPDDLPTLRAAASFGLSAGWPEEAQVDLRRIIALSSKAPEDAAWARRLLAVILAGSSDPKKKIEALSILGLAEGGDQSEPSDDEPIEEVRARARVLALQGSRPAREAAIQLLERLARRDGLAVDDRFLLARLYRRAGAWPRYQAEMLTLLSDDSPSPALLADFAGSLLRRGEAADVGRWVEKLEAAEGGSGRSVELRARLLKAEGRGDESADLIVKYAEADDARALPAVALLEELGRPDKAEALLDRHASRSRKPQVALLKAVFLARQGRLPPALDLCEAALKDCPPGEVALAAVAAIYAAAVDAGQDERAAKVVEAASRANPKAAEFPYHLANVRSHQGRYPEALALYRRSLAADPENTGPMNNLAWLLTRTGQAPDEASGLIDRVVALSGPVPDVLDTRGLVRLAGGRAEEAILDLEEAIAEVDSPPAATLLHLAEARLLAGDREAAKRLVARIDTLKPGPAALHPLDASALARAREELARKADAGP